MKSLKSVITSIFSVAIVAGVVVGINNVQNITDWLRLRNYVAPPQVVALADTTTMTPLGRKLFYVYQPQILKDKAEFRKGCSNFEATIVLGCYVSNERIYIFDVDDARLNGVEEVTSAHEMLHVVYQRMPSKEKERINELLNSVYNTLTDERILETINSYKDDENADIENELHSILGTELRKLPKELEDHYKKYFTSRAKIVALSEKYESAFTQRRNKIEQYDKELGSLKSSITRIQADLSLQSSALADERKVIEGMSSSSSNYRNTVTSYNSKVTAYNEDIVRLKVLVNKYNSYVKKRNSIALEEKDLVDSLDTSIPKL